MAAGILGRERKREREGERQYFYLSDWQKQLRLTSKRTKLPVAKY